MFTIHFTDAEPKTITRKANAIKAAERDGATHITAADGSTVWGEAPKPRKATTAKTKAKVYRLDGATAAADLARAEEIAARGAALDGFEMVPAEEIAEGDRVLGRTRDGVREVAEIRTGKKWVTGLDAKGRVFVYVPVGSLVAREAK